MTSDRVASIFALVALLSSIVPIDERQRSPARTTTLQSGSVVTEWTILVLDRPPPGPLEATVRNEHHRECQQYPGYQACD